MKKLLIWIATIFCPGILFFINEKFFKMLFAFALQVSILGWIPAMIWAKRDWNRTQKETANVSDAQPVSNTNPPPQSPQNKIKGKQ